MTTKVCKKCSEELPLTKFYTYTQRKPYDGQTYYKGTCKACVANTYERKTGKGFAGKITEEEKNSLITNSELFKSLSIAEFHRMCDMKMKYCTFYNYIKKGEVQRFFEEQKPQEIQAETPPN